MNAKPSFTSSPLWRYGFLGVLLVMLAWICCDLPQKLHSDAPGRFTSVIISLMLIFQHIAFWCLPAGRFKTVFNVFVYAWTIFGCAYSYIYGF